MFLILKLRERLALAKEQNVVLGDENTALKERIAGLESENAQQKTELLNLQKAFAESERAEDATPVGYVRHETLLWRQTASGFEGTPFCLSCVKPMCDHAGPNMRLEWRCVSCGFTSNRYAPPNLTGKD